MKPAYLLCHGFGFSHEYWRNLTPLLDGDIVYFDKNFTAKRSYIGIGHSVGFQKLNNSDIKFDYLIGLQGFVNFCGSAEESKKEREQNIDRMIKAFQTNALMSLKMFYNACGYEGSIPETPVEELIEDLISMKKSYRCRDDCPVLIIGSDDDEIVPMSIISDNFADLRNVTTEKINGVPHSLGFLKAAEVSEKIITCRRQEYVL
jgi:pimeloyl-[acyl-carrier protein] methyl ester esterase